MAGEAPRYGAFAVQYGVGNEQEVARRSQSWRLRIVGAASTMLVGVVCIASIISPQDLKGQGRKMDKLYVSMGYQHTFITSETEQLLGTSSRSELLSKGDADLSYKDLPAGLKGKRRELSSDLVALRKLAGGHDDTHSQSTDSVTKSAKDPSLQPLPAPGSKASEIIAQAQQEISKASKLDGGKKIEDGLAMSTRQGAELQVAQLATQQNPKPFASDKKWSVAKQKSDMDSWFDSLDHHATASLASSHRSVSQHALREALPAAQSAATTGHRPSLSGQQARAVEESYFDKLVSADRTAHDKLHSTQTLATASHKMSDAAARKDALSFYSTLEGAAEQQRAKVVAEDKRREAAAILRVQARHRAEREEDQRSEEPRHHGLSDAAARSGMKSFYSSEIGVGGKADAHGEEGGGHEAQGHGHVERPLPAVTDATNNKRATTKQAAAARLSAKHVREAQGGPTPNPASAPAKAHTHPPQASSSSSSKASEAPRKGGGK